MSAFQKSELLWGNGFVENRFERVRDEFGNQLIGNIAERYGLVIHKGLWLFLFRNKSQVS